MIALVDFNLDKNITGWSVVDDVVMGGRSNGDFGLSAKGNGIFSGKVSLENNGGFSSVKYGVGPFMTADFSFVALRVKGDGKRYQFRLKNKSTDRHSYVTHFKTSGHWEDIRIDLRSLCPTYRGNELNLPNYNKEGFEELSFLIANRIEESFRLEVNAIYIVR